MPLYVTYISYSAQGTRGLLEKPDDRAVAVGAMIEAAGGTLVDFYMVMGPHDGIVISDMPDDRCAIALGMIALASGTLASVQTVRAWKSDEFRSVAEKAAAVAHAFKPPGAA